MVLKKRFGTCPECHSDRIIYDVRSGEIVCRDCGLVMTDVMFSEGPDSASFHEPKREGRSRAATPYLYSIPDKGLPTEIGRVDLDASGRRLPAKTRLKMMRLKYWQRKHTGRATSARNLSLAMTELDRLSDRLAIPASVKERAAIVYRKALKEDLVRGRTIAGIAAASLYLACRLTQFPRSLTEISNTSLIEKKDIARCYRLLLRTFDMKVPLIDPIKYAAKIVSLAGLSDDVRDVATKILERALEKRIISGKDPMGVAAAAVYIASLANDERRTQKMIADAAGVTEVTLRNQCKSLKQYVDLQKLGIEVPD